MLKKVLVAASLLVCLSACDDDKSVSPSLEESSSSLEKDISSSSVVESSSSSEQKSSSSENVDSSSSEDLKTSSSSKELNSSSENQQVSSSSAILDQSSTSEIQGKSSSSELVEVSSSSVEQDVSSSSGEKAVWKYLNPAVSYGEMTDARDGQIYKTVKIGTQTWMAENLNYIDESVAKTYAENGICLDGNLIKCGLYGGYYKWSMAVDSVSLRSKYGKCGYGYNCAITERVQGICPEGWHLPDTTEWKTLWNYALENGEGDSVSISLKSVDGWEPNEDVSQGTNRFGFTVLPAGYYGARTDSYDNIIAYSRKETGLEASFQAVESRSGTNAWGGIYIWNASDHSFAKSFGAKYNFFSVRCIKNED